LNKYIEVALYVGAPCGGVAEGLNFK